MLIPFSPRTCSVRNAKPLEDAANATTLNDTLLQLVIEQDPGLRNQLLAAVDAKIRELEEKQEEEGEQNEKTSHTA